MPISTLSAQIGKNISNQRKYLGLTQAQLAELVGLENETISRIESAKYNVSISSLERFTKVLQLDITDIVRANSSVLPSQAESIAALLANLNEEDKETILKIVHEACNLCKK